MEQPVFMDFEASSLRLDSYPIEVAWSNGDGTIESYLIRPQPNWTDWDDYAEQEIHGIRREQLFNEGLPAEWVVGRMRGKLKNRFIYVDGGESDVVWCERLFDYKGYSGKLPFRMKHFDDLLVNEFGVWTVTERELMDAIRQQVRVEVKGQHRAAVDVRYLQGVYREVKMKAKGE